MADEPQNQAQPITTIPPEALDRWGSLPPDAPLILWAVKGDLDNLFLGLRGIVVAHSHLQSAVAALDREDRQALASSFLSSNENMVKSFNQINEFIISIMNKATPYTRAAADE